MIPLASIALGVLAGGRGERMGGADKAWLPASGTTLVETCLAQFPQAFAERIVSTRADDPRFAALGLRPVLDARPGFAGPVAGLEALAGACASPWLLTVPVDLLGIPPHAVDALRAAAVDDEDAGFAIGQAGSSYRVPDTVARHGAHARCADGPQPLLALWRVEPLRAATRRLLDAGDAAARDVVAAVGSRPVDLGPARLVNVNTLAVLEGTGS